MAFRLPRKHVLTSILLLMVTGYTLFVFYQYGIRSALYWLYLYPVIAVVLKGIKSARVWVAFFLATALNLVVLQTSSTNDVVSYPLFVTSQMFVSLFIVVLLIYLYERNEEKVAVRTTQLREEQARLTASVKSMPRGFIMTDIHGEIIMINPLAQAMLGPHTLSWTLSDVQRRLDGKFDIINSAQKVLREVVQIEPREIAFDTTVLRISLFPICLDEERKLAIGSVILLEDVTKEKAAEKAKDQFFSIASHELRTPLVLMRGNAAQLGELYGNKLDDQGKLIVKDIHDASNRLLQIVNDFLNTSRLEEGRMQFKNVTFDIAPLIDESMKELSSVAKHKGIFLKMGKTGPVPHVLGDPDRVKEVIINLVDNAIKFTPTGGVTVRVKKIENMVKVSVADTGNGVPESSKHMLFGKFQQASNNTLAKDTSKSSGLGLYIARMMMDGMGGKIYLEESTVNKGSVFSFELPVAE